MMARLQFMHVMILTMAASLALSSGNFTPYQMPWARYFKRDA
jgi:hypothetical protein